MPLKAPRNKEPRNKELPNLRRHIRKAISTCGYISSSIGKSFYGLKTQRDQRTT